MKFLRLSRIKTSTYCTVKNGFTLVLTKRRIHQNKFYSAKILWRRYLARFFCDDPYFPTLFKPVEYIFHAGCHSSERKMMKTSLFSVHDGHWDQHSVQKIWHIVGSSMVQNKKSSWLDWTFQGPVLWSSPNQSLLYRRPINIRLWPFCTIARDGSYLLQQGRVHSDQPIS